MVIGITGQKRHGKNSVGEILAIEFGFKTLALADPIKEMASHAFGWDINYMESFKEEVDPKWGISPRQVLQHLGTEWAQMDLCRCYPRFAATTNRSLWVKLCFDRIDSLRGKGGYKHFAITDVRFPHEVEAIRDNGGKILKVVRNSMPTSDVHESERYIKEIRADITIMNDSTLWMLSETVKNALRGALG
jgi:hypothetical protein